MSYKKALFLLGLLVLFFGTIFISQYKTNSNEKDVYTQINNHVSPTTQEFETEAVEVTLDILEALSNYYVATTIGTEEDATASYDTIGVIKSLLNQNRYLESGNIAIEKYLNHPNKAISVSTKGMATGALMVIQANNEIIDFYRNLDISDTKQLQELEYTVAKYLSDQKEGYKLISITAPQITTLVFKPAKSENPTGKIPYTISKKDRSKILNKIDQLFGDSLRQYELDVEEETGVYNAILFTVDAIQNNLIPETYEEAERLRL